MWVFIVVMGILIAILLAGHGFIYFSLISFFDINTVQGKIYMASGLALLGASFIFSSVLAHYTKNTCVKLYYMLSGLWLAVGWNMIMAFLFVWLLVWIFSFFGFAIQHRPLAIFALIFAFVYSGYGVWCAFHPIVKQITIHMENLPNAWKNKTAVQLSDMHLGHIYGVKFLRNVITKTQEQHPDIVFITGDLFDGMDSELTYLVQPLASLHVPDGVYFITGNHETYLGVEKSYRAIEHTPLKILDDDMVDIAGMQIVGISYPTREQDKDIVSTVQNMQNFDPAKSHIVLFHSPLNADVADKTHIKFQLAGHTHNGQLFPFQMITRSIFGSRDYGLSHINGFTTYTSRGVGTWGPAMRTSGRPEIVVIHFADL